MISAILLAAGESKRMGKPKQLLPIADSFLLDVILRRLTGSRVDETILVLGYSAELIQRKLKLHSYTKLKIVINTDYQQGMSSSIKKGIELIDGRSHAIMIMLADLPWITTDDINRLIYQYNKIKPQIIVPVYKGMRGHPVIFDIKFKNELLQLHGDQGARELIRRYQHCLQELKFQTPAIISDVDTITDCRGITEYVDNY